MSVPAVNKKKRSLPSGPRATVVRTNAPYMPDTAQAPIANLSRVVRVHRRFSGPASLWLAAWLLTSCAVFRHRLRPDTPSTTAVQSPPPAPTITTAPTAHRVGTVRVIGNAQRFVLIEVPSGATSALSDGQLLRCAADPSAAAPATATLRVGRERRRPYVVADVVNGEPRVGDAVFIATMPPASMNPGPLVLPTTTSGVLPIALPDANPAPANSRP